jgi:hypothetical protein
MIWRTLESPRLRARIALLSLNELRSLLLLALNLGDSRVLHIIKVIALIFLTGNYVIGLDESHDHDHDHDDEDDEDDYDLSPDEEHRLTLADSDIQRLLVVL